MRTTIIDWEVAVGVEWLMPTDARELKEARKARSSQHFVLASVGRQQWAGFHDATEGKTKVYAAALLVAIVKPNAVVYSPLSRDEAWVCAIADGMPVVGYDKVLPSIDARSTAIEWSSIFPKADMVGAISGAQTTLEDVLASINEGLVAKQIRKQQISAAVLKKNGVQKRDLVRGAALIGAGVLVLVGLDVYRGIMHRKDEQQLTLAAAVQDELEARRSRELEQRNIHQKQVAFHAQGEALRKQYADRVSPLAYWSAFTRLRQSIPLSRNGFRPHSYDCTADACTLTWAGDKGRFTTAASKTALPGVTSASLTTTELTATSSFPLTVAREPLRSYPSPTPEQFRVTIAALGVHMTGFSTEATRPILAIPEPSLQQAPVTVAHVGHWRLQVSTTMALISVGDALRLLTAYPVRITSLKYDVTTGGMLLEGDYILLYGKDS